jgi:hypothetical protein
MMWRVVALLMMLMILQGCSSSGSAPSLPTAPTVVIPDDYTTFTDISQTFSVRYPQYWSLNLSAVESANDVLDSSPLDVDFSQTVSVFSAGDESFGGYEPNLAIRLETILDSYDVDQYAEAGVRFLRDNVASGSIERQQPVLLGNLRGQIIEWSADLSEVFPGESGRWNVVGLFAKRVGEGHGWALACAFGESAPTESRRTCNLVISSFRLLD